MTLFDWIVSVGGPAKAAEILKESARAVSSWFYSEKVPSPKAAKVIVERTKGAVDYNGIYAPVFARMAVKEAKKLTKKKGANQ